MIPFFGVAIIRNVANEDLAVFELFQPTEIAFAMFVLSVWVLLAASGSRMDELPHKQSAIQSVALAVVVGFLAIFFVTSFRIERALSVLDEEVEEISEVFDGWKEESPIGGTTTLDNLYAADRRFQIKDHINHTLKPELERLGEEDRSGDIKTVIDSLLEEPLVREIADQPTPEAIEAILKRELEQFFLSATPDDPTGDDVTGPVADRLFEIRVLNITELFDRANSAQGRFLKLGDWGDWLGLRFLTFALSISTILAAVALQWRYDLSDSVGSASSETRPNNRSSDNESES